MKNKIIKILSLILLVATLTACGGNVSVDSSDIEINKDKYAIEDSKIAYNTNGWFSRISEEDFNKIVNEALAKAKVEFPNAKDVRQYGDYKDDDNGTYGYIVNIYSYEDKELCMVYGIELPIEVNNSGNYEKLKWYYNVVNGDILSTNKSNDIIKEKLEELAKDSGLTDMVEYNISNTNDFAVPLSSTDFEKCSISYIDAMFEALEFNWNPRVGVKKLSISREDAQKALEKMIKEVDDIEIYGKVINTMKIPSVTSYEGFMDITDEEWEYFQTGNEK